MPVARRLYGRLAQVLTVQIKQQGRQQKHNHDDACDPQPVPRLVDGNHRLFRAFRPACVSSDRIEFRSAPKKFRALLSIRHDSNTIPESALKLNRNRRNIWLFRLS